MSDDTYGLAVLEFDAVRVDYGPIATLAHMGDVTVVSVLDVPIMDVSTEGAGS